MTAMPQVCATHNVEAPKAFEKDMLERVSYRKAKM